MPTIKKVGPYRIFFFSGDRDEPEHVHVERDENIAKFWLDPVRLETSGGFSRVELQRIQKIVEEHMVSLREAWHDFFQN